MDENELAVIEAALTRKPRIVEDIAAVDTCLLARQANPNVGLTGGKEWLQPVVEAFHCDMHAFMKWVGRLAEGRRKAPKVRDRTELRHLYRNIYQRVYMDAKRVRISKGLALLERRLGRTMSPEEVDKLARKLQLAWGDEKYKYVEKHGGKVVSYAERMALFEQFWSELDRALDKELRE